jgi:NTE family protein
MSSQSPRNQSPILFTLFALLLTCASLPGYAQVEAQAATPSAVHRPRIALVLSGGGARGLAHIGVLRVLHELHVPVDVVVGTSMGAVVGGAYAAGRTVEELERITRDTAWEDVLADRPTRDSLAYRRREEDLLLPSRLEFSITRTDGLSLPPAAASNAALEDALIKLLPAGLRDQPVDHLGIPFRSVASDLVTGDLVELSGTPLFLALRASLAVPGMFAPVRVDNRLVVDGGLVRNLPVDMARAMHADIVIAVNVGTPLAPERELTSALGVARQMLQILTEQNVQRSLRELGPEDVLIAPDLGGIGFLDFGEHDRAVRAGEAAARALAPRLARRALPADQYAALEARRAAVMQAAQHADDALPLGRIDVRGATRVNPDVLVAQSGLREGQVRTREQVRAATALLYGRDDIDNVDTAIEDVDGQRNVHIQPTDSPLGHSRLRLGLELASDFGDGNNFSLGMMHVTSALNSYDAELRTVARIGSQRQFGVQWWQPVAPGSPWYVAPSLSYGANSATLFSEGRRLYRVGLRYADVTLAAGRQMANWGDFQVGFRRRLSRGTLLIPEDQSFPAYHYYDSSRFAALTLDTLDSVAFPARGHLLVAQVERAREHLPGLAPLTQFGITSLAAFGSGDWAGHIYGEWSRSNLGTAPQPLGGFLRLSGTTPESLEARTVAFGRLVAAHRIGDMPPPFGGAVRLGFSLEIGGGFQARQPIHMPDLKQAGSIFISADTRFGPLYLGTGATRGTGGTFYLFLGPIW